MANKAASEQCVCIIRDDQFVQICSAHAAAIRNRDSAELDKVRGELAIKSEFISTRQCPDHSGKWPRGRCLQCELESAAAELEQWRAAWESMRDEILSQTLPLEANDVLDIIDGHDPAWPETTKDSGHD